MLIYQIFLLSILHIISCEEGWTGKWFPDNSTEAATKIEPVDIIAEGVTSSKDWNGKWFPLESSKIQGNSATLENDRIMGIPNTDCDDGQTNLSNDFDPHNYDHALNYLCLEETIKPSYDIEPIQTFKNVPKLYTPVHKCMNETIIYDQRIPLFGTHRPLWAAYGDYIYLPVERWLHNVEHGAVVALYHPCANKDQIERMKNLVKGCLYRHVITPYRKLLPERPFALVAWATSLEFSVIDESILTDFIKNHAKTAPEKTSRNGLYTKFIREPSKIISDEDDDQLCPNVNVKKTRDMM